jgi:uncharacterized membrane protein HdeD (DUF308 family)
MVDLLTQHWWTWALRGAAAVLFGVSVLIWPGAGLAVFVALFGAYALVSGIFALVGAAETRKWNQPSWVMLIDGLLGVAAGVVTFVWPAVTALALVYIIASWALLTGIVEVVGAFRYQRELGMGDAWLMGLAGTISALFGGLLIVHPGAGALAVVTVIGLYAIFFGVAMLVFGFRLQAIRKDLGLEGRRELQYAA